MARFAIAALAGEMATKFSLTGWTPGTAKSAAFELFQSWVEARDGATRAEIDEVVARTQDYVIKNLDCFSLLGASADASLDGWGDESWIYIDSECWRVIHKDEDAIDMARLH